MSPASKKPTSGEPRDDDLPVVLGHGARHGGDVSHRCGASLRDAADGEWPASPRSTRPRSCVRSASGPATSRRSSADRRWAGRGRAGRQGRAAERRRFGARCSAWSWRRSTPRWRPRRKAAAQRDCALAERPRTSPGPPPRRGQAAGPSPSQPPDGTGHPRAGGAGAVVPPRAGAPRRRTVALSVGHGPAPPRRPTTGGPPSCGSRIATDLATFVELAPAAGPPPEPPLARLGPALAGGLSGMILEDAGRLQIRLGLAVPPSRRRATVALPRRRPCGVPLGARARRGHAPERSRDRGAHRLPAGDRGARAALACSGRARESGSGRCERRSWRRSAGPSGGPWRSRHSSSAAGSCSSCCHSSPADGRGHRDPGLARRSRCSCSAADARGRAVHRRPSCWRRLLALAAAGLAGSWLDLALVREATEDEDVDRGWRAGSPLRPRGRSRIRLARASPDAARARLWRRARHQRRPTTSSSRPATRASRSSDADLRPRARRRCRRRAVAWLVGETVGAAGGAPGGGGRTGADRPARVVPAGRLARAAWRRSCSTSAVIVGLTLPFLLSLGRTWEHVRALRPRAGRHRPARRPPSCCSSRLDPRARDPRCRPRVARERVDRGGRSRLSRDVTEAARRASERSRRGPERPLLHCPPIAAVHPRRGVIDGGARRRNGSDLRRPSATPSARSSTTRSSSSGIQLAVIYWMHALARGVVLGVPGHAGPVGQPARAVPRRRRSSSSSRRSSSRSRSSPTGSSGPQERIGDVYERNLAEEAMLAEIEAIPHCPTCDRRVEAAWIICPTCRTRLNRVCPNCTRLVGLDWSLCAWCGREFERHDQIAASADRADREPADARGAAGRRARGRERADPPHGPAPRAGPRTKPRTVDRAAPMPEDRPEEPARRDHPAAGLGLTTFTIEGRQRARPVRRRLARDVHRRGMASPSTRSASAASPAACCSSSGCWRCRSGSSSSAAPRRSSAARPARPTPARRRSSSSSPSSPISRLAGFVVGLPLVADRGSIPVPVGRPDRRVIVQAGVFRGVVAADGRRARRAALAPRWGSSAGPPNAARGMLGGAVLAGPVILRDPIVGYVAVQIAGVAPASPLPPTGTTPGSRCTSSRGP